MFNKILTSFHSLLPLLFALIALFSYNIFILLVTAGILLITIIVNHKYGDCPITLIEDKYNNHEFSMIDYMANNTINLFGEKYTKNDRALYTLEMLWTCLLLILLKILVIFIIVSIRNNKTLRKFML